MAITAFLPTGAPQILPFIGTPGAGTVGHALVWSQSPQGFTLAPIAVGPDQFSGVLPVSKGGTGGVNSSDARISLGLGTLATQNSTAVAITGGNLSGIASLATTNLTTQFLTQDAENVLARFESYSYSNTAFHQPQFIAFRARGTRSNPSGINVTDQIMVLGAQPRGRTGWSDIATGFYVVPLTSAADSISATNPPCKINFAGAGVSGNYEVWADFSYLGVNFPSTAESTSTTTGAVRVSGGLGVVKNVNVGGNLKVSGGAINFANLPTSNAGLAVGDLWRDGEILKIRV